MSSAVGKPVQVDHDLGDDLYTPTFPIWNNHSWVGSSWTRPEDELALIDLDYGAIRRYANAALRAADVRHVVPTPLDHLRQSLDLTSTVELDALAEDIPPMLLARLRRTVFKKVRGFLAVRERLVHIDRDLRHSQGRFVLGHELGHFVLPWQRDAYQVDTDSTLAPTVRNRFEREANAFSSELLFNIDELKLRSLGAPLSLSTPVELHQQFDASLISTTRRFVEDHDASAALLFLGQFATTSMNKPGSRILYGVQSRKFATEFGAVIPGLRLAPAWPWDLHDLAYHSYRAVTSRDEPHVRGHYMSHIGAHFRFEVFAARPFPFVLLTPARRLSRPPRTRIVLRDETTPI